MVADFEMGTPVFYRPQQGQPVQRVTFLMNKGRNTSYVVSESDKLVVASANQLAPMAKDSGHDGAEDRIVQSNSGTTPNAQTVSPTDSNQGTNDEVGRAVNDNEDGGSDGGPDYKDLVAQGSCGPRRSGRKTKARTGTSVSGGRNVVILYLKIVIG